MPLSDKIYKVMVQVAIINFALAGVIGGRLVVNWYIEMRAEREVKRLALLAEYRLNAILNNNSIKILDAHGEGTYGNEVDVWEDGMGGWFTKSGMPYGSFKVNVTVKNYLDFTVNNLKVLARKWNIGRTFNLTANQELTLSFGYSGSSCPERVDVTLYYNGTKIDQLKANVTRTWD